MTEWRTEATPRSIANSNAEVRSHELYISRTSLELQEPIDELITKTS